jgi:mycothiol system anti-sigma-R factor
MGAEEMDKPDCAEALARLEFFIDHELAQADSDEIRKHLQDCAPCLEIHDIEQAVKALVARSCSERAPEALRERVLVRIREVHVTITEQHGVVAQIACQALGRLPWFAPFFLRARRLRPVFPMVHSFSAAHSRRPHPLRCARTREIVPPGGMLTR